VNSDADKVTMCYKGGTSNPDALICVFTWRGHEWEIPYTQMRQLAHLYAMPESVREHLLHWAKMMHNPD